ncbi:MAG: hypothetical protein IKW89_13890, partial [Bacteroidales bacterium]|nr:hypothetical protein [Bacteroidales bacterium]
PAGRTARHGGQDSQPDGQDFSHRFHIFGIANFCNPKDSKNGWFILIPSREIRVKVSVIMGAVCCNFRNYH